MLTGFWTVFDTMAILFVISLIGWTGVRTRIINEDGLNGLTRVLIDVVTPARLIIDITGNLNRETLSDSILILLAVIVMSFCGFGLGAVAVKIWKDKTETAGRQKNRAIIAACGLSNGIFLPLPLLLALAPPEYRSLATLYVGTGYLVMVVMQWTIGVYLLSGDDEESTKPKSFWQQIRPMINIPVIAIICAILMSLFPPLVHAARGEETFAFLKIPFEAARLLGGAVSPLAMLILGMIIAQTTIKSSLCLRTILIPGTVRLLISPLLMLVFIRFSGISSDNSLLAITLMVVASMPTATALSIISRRFGGDWQTIATIILITYFAALITVPLWVGLQIGG